ncbi:MAG: DUF3087 domain-containing protein [Pseudomonadales bacterium]|nr:DUF3087 domain-containing protein [Pseudomonadales bacterium]
MQLQDINKPRYRKHLNIVIAALITSLLVMALLFGQILIALFSDGEGSNFILNLSGVVLAGLVCLSVVYTYRQHDFMTEVFYVWQLKQGLNKIYRKLRKIETAAFDNKNIDAVITLNYYHLASSQLFTLDDNTITLDSLQLEINKLQSLIEDNNLTINAEDYTPSMLAAF